MKARYILFASAVMAFVACGKVDVNGVEPDMPNGVSFSAGEKVTLFVSTDSENKSKVSSEYIEDKINFKWEEGDKILVTVGTKSCEFTITDGVGTASGRFVGEMPAAGNDFKVQYPSSNPVLTTQVLSSEPLPRGMMKFTGTGALDQSKTSHFQLTPAYSALKLNLYGANVTVNSIKLTLNSKDYTLNCGEGGVALESEEKDAKQFIIVVPPVTNQAFTIVADAVYTDTEYQKVDYLTYGYGKPITKRYFYSDKKTFTANVVKNMPAVELRTTVWAPVNCGYDATNFKYGKYYQFGRYVGGGYYYKSDTEEIKDAGGSQYTKKVAASTKWDETTKVFKSPANDTFYYDKVGEDKKPITGHLGDWYTNVEAKQLTKWPHSSTDEGYVADKIGDPCPEGWRLPTVNEMKDLIGGFTSGEVIKNDGTHGTTTKVYGCFYDGTPTPVRKDARCLFLPASAYLSATGGDDKYKRGEELCYWTSEVGTGSSAYGGYGLMLRLASTTTHSSIHAYIRAYGLSVRCVME